MTATEKLSMARQVLRQILVNRWPGLPFGAGDWDTRKNDLCYSGYFFADPYAWTRIYCPGYCYAKSYRKRPNIRVVAFMWTHPSVQLPAPLKLMDRRSRIVINILRHFGFQFQAWRCHACQAIIYKFFLFLNDIFNARN